jgi:hypothetical protein
MDRIRNETIRMKMGMKEGILKETEEVQLRWHGQIMQMEDCRITRHVAEWSAQGKRRRCRPGN